MCKMQTCPETALHLSSSITVAQFAAACLTAALLGTGTFQQECASVLDWIVKHDQSGWPTDFL